MAKFWLIPFTFQKKNNHANGLKDQEASLQLTLNKFLTLSIIIP